MHNSFDVLPVAAEWILIGQAVSGYFRISVTREPEVIKPDVTGLK